MLLRWDAYSELPAGQGPHASKGAIFKFHDILMIDAVRVSVSQCVQTGWFVLEWQCDR